MKKAILFLTLILTLSTASFAQDQDNTPDPVVSLREQIEAAPNPVERNRLHLQLAELLLSKGQKTEALSELQVVASSDSFDPTGFYNLGNSFARLGETDAAINAYQIAIDQRKGRYSRAYNNLGVVLLRVGRWDEAQEALLSALKLEGFRYAEASYNLGRVYSARGQYDLAVREWRRALKVNPEHDAAADALSRVGTEGRIGVEPQPAKASVAKPAAAEPAAKSPVLDQASYDFLQRARDAVERGKMTEAVDNFKRVLSRESGYFAPANLELSYALVSLKRYDEALVQLQQVAQRDGARYPISYFHLARLYEMRGDLKLAEESFAKAVAASPANAQFLLDLSRVREKLSDYKGALEAMEQYVKVAPENGKKLASSEERLAELRSKAAGKQ
ncbi:MAG TPA: tetratricopeptide repeat protein [Pyrinomonadaceae bacterium]|nr:tetratricopeptide repeat protein [Pyrinomonadaceae bacterium]